jgi:hypothetical protein
VLQRSPSRPVPPHHRFPWCPRSEQRRRLGGAAPPLLYSPPATPKLEADQPRSPLLSRRSQKSGAGNLKPRSSSTPVGIPFPCSAPLYLPVGLLGSQEKSSRMRIR